MTADGKDCNYLKYLNTSSYIATDSCVGTVVSGFNISQIFSCSANGQQVTYTAYNGSLDCSGNILNSTIITKDDAEFEFLCTGEDCSVQFGITFYFGKNCTTDSPLVGDYSYVAGKCYSSSSTSYVYCCNNDYLTIYFSPYRNCSNLSVADIIYSDTCTDTNSSFFELSIYPEIKYCAQPGYCGGSMFLSPFSSFVVFGVIISYFCFF
jgi:hypothetical protein